MEKFTMKISDYLKRLESNDSSLVLMDAEDGSYNNKTYTIAFTEAGDKYTFVRSNLKTAIDANIAKVDGETIVIEEDKVVHFDSGLTHIQVSEVKAWTVDAVKTRGAK